MLENPSRARGRETKDKDKEQEQPQARARWVELIEAFDGAIRAAFGEAQARPWPAQADGPTATALAEAGITAADVARVAGLAFRRMAGQGKRPPGTLGYLRAALLEDLAARQSDPVAAAAARPPRAATLRDHCLAWANGDDWPAEAGPAPDEDGCRASRADLAFAAGSCLPDRDRARCGRLQRRLGLDDSENRMPLALVAGGEG